MTGPIRLSPTLLQLHIPDKLSYQKGIMRRVGVNWNVAVRHSSLVNLAIMT